MGCSVWQALKEVEWIIYRRRGQQVVARAPQYRVIDDYFICIAAIRHGALVLRQHATCSRRANIFHIGGLSD